LNAPDGPVIPSRFAGTLASLLGGDGCGVEVGVDPHSICFRMPGISVSLRRLAAKFARYWMLPPLPEVARISVPAEAFATALESALVVSDQEAVRVNLAFEPGRLVVSSPGTGRGRAQAAVPCEYDGPALNLSYRGDHLLAPLAGLSGSGNDPVELVLYGEDSPLDYRASGYWHRVQPVAVEVAEAAKPAKKAKLAAV
jgi:DNA polymerase III sliding clamp (beta) subunit (PCNA family)